MKFTEIIGLFKENKTVTRSHMKNLLEMAMADRHFDDTEYELLATLAKKYKVSEKELEKIKEDPSNIDFELPKKREEKFEQFYELVHMMAVDHDIDRAEMSLCKIFATKFGYENADEMINVIVENIKNGLDWKESLNRVSLYNNI
jgi:uncharacterized tellurite resistance protein B-like protein